MKKLVTFQFSSLDDLWSFRIATLIHYIDMDKAECLVTCECTTEQIDLAVKKYHALVVTCRQV